MDSHDTIHRNVLGDHNYHHEVSRESILFQDTPSESPKIKGLTRTDQIEKLTTSFKEKNKKIGVFCGHSQLQNASRIHCQLSDLLVGGKSTAEVFEILPQMSNWLHKALCSGVDYFIFLGLPPGAPSGVIPQSETVMEISYFDTRQYEQRVAEVVVIFLSQSGYQHSHAPHYLDGYMRVENENMEEVAEDSLALFAGKFYVFMHNCIIPGYIIHGYFILGNGSCMVTYSGLLNSCVVSVIIITT